MVHVLPKLRILMNLFSLTKQFEANMKLIIKEVGPID
jgi:hypothetical protein